MSTTVFARQLAARTSQAVSSTSEGLSASGIIEEAEQHWSVTGRSVIIAWIATGVGGLVTICLFSLIRERYPLIYAPRTKAYRVFLTEAEKETQSNKREKSDKSGKSNKSDEKVYDDDMASKGVFVPLAPQAPTGFVSWLKPTWDDFIMEFKFLSRSEVEKRDFALLRMLGLDAVTFLQYLRLLRWLFTCISLVVAVPLSVANYYINTDTQYGSVNSTASDTLNSTERIENMEVYTAANITGEIWYVHIMFECFITGLVWVFVHLHSEHHKVLVREWAELNHNEIAFKTIMVTNLDFPSHEHVSTGKDDKKEKRQLSLRAVQNTVRRKIGLDPKTDANVEITRENMSQIAKHIKEFEDDLFVKFDRSFTPYLRAGGRSQHYDNEWKKMIGTVSVGGVKGRCDWADGFGTVAQDPKEHIRTAVAKKHYIEKIQTKARGIPSDGKQADAPVNISSAFVTLGSVREAHRVVEKFHARWGKGKLGKLNVQRSPRPKNLLWENLEMDAKARRTKRTIGRIVLYVICFVNTLPVMAITVLANINSAVEAVPWLNNLSKSSIFWKYTFEAIAGILPASISAAFSYFLPILMRYLGKKSGAFTRGQLDKDVIKQLFFFLLVSNFVVFSLLGVLYTSYLDIADQIGKGKENWNAIRQALGNVPTKIAETYIEESSYWLSWYPLHAVLSFIQLLQLPRVGAKLYQTFFLARTTTEVNRVTKPDKFEMFAMVVSMVYTPLAPLVVICGTVYFWAASIAFTYQLKYVEDTKESDGKVWRIVINRLLVSLLLMQILMALTVYLKTRSYLMTPFAGAPILVTGFIKMSFDNQTSSADVIGLRGVGDKREIPAFEHELLKPASDWMPRYQVHPDDKEMLHTVLDDESFRKAGLHELIPHLVGKKR